MQFIKYCTENENRMVLTGSDGYKCIQLFIYPHDHVTDRELQLAAPAWYHKGILYCILLPWEKIKIWNSQYAFYWRSIALTALQIWKIINWTILSWEPPLLIKDEIEAQTG